MSHLLPSSVSPGSAPSQPPSSAVSSRSPASSSCGGRSSRRNPT